MSRRRRRGAGFTILEILIAVFILAVGVIGVIALHTASIRTANQATLEGTASNLARSLYEAFEEGIRQRAFVVQEGTAPANHYVRGFLIRHQGVSDPTTGPAMPTLPTSINDTASLTALRASDYTFFMPSVTGPTGAAPDPIFVFPRPNTATTDNAWPGVDNWITAGAAGHDGLVYLDVKRTYSLAPSAPRPAGVPSDAVDLISFAFAIRRAKVPVLTDAATPPNTLPFVVPNSGANLGLDPNLFPPRAPATVNSGFQDGLYTVQILIYRSFDPTTTSPNHSPIYEFNSLIAMGP